MFHKKDESEEHDEYLRFWRNWRPHDEDLKKLKKEHDEERNPWKNTMKIHQTKDPKKKKLHLELHRHYLRHSWVREICVHVGVSDLLFVYLFLICCSFVFLLICQLFLCVSILVFFVFLFWCSNVYWNLFMELESLKLKFHTGNQVLNTWFSRRLFSISSSHHIQIEF